MFPIPEILSDPMFSALGSGTVLYPTVGAVLAWMVIAGFVGSALGMLRDGLRAPEGRREGTRVLHGAPQVHALRCREAS